ncbi:MAG TPA: hypothetical protein VGO14_10695 [Solirubrobacteraceae bacterium]|nr:hypothetical protein [Solirubrobacteraceae bacterium]
MGAEASVKAGAGDVMRRQAPGAAARRAVGVVVVVLLSWLATTALSQTSALAATGHKFLSQLSEAPKGTPLSEPEAAAVDKEGNVFVGDAGQGAVDVFDSSGAFRTQFGAGILSGELRGVAIDESSGDVYVADAGTNAVDVFKPNGAGGYEMLSEWTGAGTPGAAFGAVAGVAVDSSSAKVYVVDAPEGVVDIFKAFPKGPQEAHEGEFLGTLKGGKLEEPEGATVDPSTGKVYVADGFTEAVDVFSSAGTFEKKLTGKGTPTKAFEPVAVGVEAATGDLYVVDSRLGVVDQFKASGEWVGWLTTAAGQSFKKPRGVAIAPAGNVYVADAEAGVVDVFGPSVVVPDAKSGKASKFERGSPPTFKATLNGSINPDGIPATYHFEYAEAEEFEATHAYSHSTEVTSAGAGSSEVAVHALAEGLKPQTGYDFRIVAQNENGTNYGADVTFETPPAVAGVTTGPASNVQPTSATLSGSLQPKALRTEYHFEYGETTSYGQSSPVPDAETSSGTTTPVETALTGLRPNTTYHFRLVAKNEWGTTFGLDETFKTLGPPRIISQSSESNGHTSETIKAQINPGGLDTHYRFEYGETTAYGTSVPAPDADIGSGGAPVSVSAGLTGLKLATTYHFRVVASNSAETVEGPDQEFTTVLIESESASEVTGESARLGAQINPLGEHTTYHFEYGETTSYGTSIPVPDGDLGTAVGDQTVNAALLGLHPATTYHYRVLATVQGLGTGLGPDHTFTTLEAGHGFTLADGRAYEMLSPPDKQGGFIEGINRIGGVVQASEDGGALAYVVDGAIVENPDGNRSPEAQQVISTRSSSGWVPQEIVAPHDRAFGIRPGVPPEYVLFSSDLSLSLLQPFPFGLTALAEPPLAPPQSPAERGHQEKTIYLREDAPIAPGTSEAAIYDAAKHNGETLAGEHGEAEAKPGYLPLVTAGNVAPGTTFGGFPENGSTQKVQPNIIVLDGTPDLSHVVLASNKALAPTGPSAPGLYEWAEGKLQLVSVLPSGAPEEAAEADLGFGPGQIHHQEGTNFRHAISDDGSRVIWTSSESAQGGEQGFGHLYLRDTRKGQSVQLDLPQGNPIAEPGKAQFQIASSDGSKVFFTDTQRLTSNSSAAPEIASEGLPPRADLYECEVVEVGGKLTCKLSDLTPDANPGESAAVQGLLLGASEDGSYLYFVANGVLAPGATQGACTTKPGQPPPAGTTCNLYAMHLAGGKWTTSLIARLSAEDAPDWFDPNQNARLLVDLTARVAPHGRYLAFMSNRRLTGYDNTDVNEVEGRHADEEVFLYDASSGRITCVSCNPTGARPNGVFDQRFAGEGVGLVVDRPEVWVSIANPGVDHWLAGNIPGWTPLFINGGIYQSRYLSDSGRLFFNSADPLVPQAVGHTRLEKVSEAEKEPQSQVGIENVYQYEPSGVGSCTSASGCVGLISSAASNKESAFMDASASGNDVFFLTASALLPQDRDINFDVYDARVCSESSPCLPPVPPPREPCASAATCKEGSASPPTFQPPPSSDVSSPGNTPHIVTLPVTVTKLTTAQKLAKALKACRKLPHRTKAQKKKRAACETQARRKYKVKKATKTAHAHRRGR